MRLWKARLDALLRPRLCLLIPLTALCSAALFYVFYHRLDASAAAYLVYALSAYALAVWAVRVPGAVRRGSAAVHQNRLGHRYLTDLQFRGRLTLRFSTGFNLCYALWKLGAGIYYGSFWFGAIAVYYLILALMRGLLSLGEHRGNLARQYRAVLLCGCLLVPLNAALAALTVQMVRDGRGYAYPGYLIFVAAGYAFYAVTFAVVNLVRFRRLNSPVLVASKVLGLATALVSMLSLQTAMFASFGGEFAFQRVMNAATGGVVCLSVFLMAVLMVLWAGRQMRRGNLNFREEPQ